MYQRAKPGVKRLSSRPPLCMSVKAAEHVPAAEHAAAAAAAAGLKL
jgi:hypothetical protein